MRYCNLKKRNTSKFNIISKRVASVSLVCLAFLSILALPLSFKASEIQQFDQNKSIQLDEENLGNDHMDVLNQESLDESVL